MSMFLLMCTGSCSSSNWDDEGKFIIDPDVKDFYAFTRDSFKIEGYEYSDFNGKIPVAV